MLDYGEVIQELRDAFKTRRTLNIAYRKSQLKALYKMYDDNEQAFSLALAQDLHKPHFESVLFEINVLKNDVHHVLSNIDKWTKTESVSKTVATFFDSSRIHHDPYGVVLIMGAWNFPAQLGLAPLSGAIAAGNAAVIKPSEMAPATSNLIAKLLPQYLDEDMYRVLEGGIPETTEILKQRFDYIFYTGSTTVGRIVREAANKYLTPVTLELGGKSPVYLDNTVDIDAAARRILWGKLVNCGQICIAPDYLLCSKEVEIAFIAKAKEVIKSFYGEDPQKSQDYCRIINKRHVQRLQDCLKGGNIALGGKVDLDDQYVEPTVINDISLDSKLMQEEIFGPLLPIHNVNSVKEAIDFINAREKPLALYVFSNDDKNVVNPLIKNTSFGGCTVNDVIFHFSVEDLPFGGVGYSGMGAYHGKESYLTFTHRKSVLHRNYNKIADYLGGKRYAPYTSSNLSALVSLVAPRWTPCWGAVTHLLTLGLGVGVGAAVTYFAKAVRCAGDD